VLTDPGRGPLGLRAWIGDGRRGASLAPDGTVDWYAGAPAAVPDLWRLVDESGPAVRVGPVRDGGRARRHLPPATVSYRPGTNVVETIAEGSGGRRVAVTDFMPWPDGGGLVRLVRALSGPVEVEVEVLPGPARGPGGARRTASPTAGGFTVGGLTVAVAAPMTAAPIDRDTPRWRAVLRLDAGEEAVVAIGDEIPLAADAAHRLLDDTIAAWRSWLGRLAYGGPYRQEVERALLLLRALTPPGGGPAAAGTTSLPRRPGSERGSDSRWVRVRDAARATRVLAASGLAEDAEEAETWLRHTVAEAHLPWPSWLDADGQPVPEPEDWPVGGWRHSQPVLLGRPRAIDVGLVGAVAAAVGASTSGPGGRRDDPGPLSAAYPALAEATDWAADHWRQPDHGRWDIGRPLRNYTAGRIEVWSALRRMASLARSRDPLDLQAAAWQQEGRELLSWLESDGLAPDGGLRMDGGPGDEADAALLPALRSGPWPATDPVVAATVGRTIERLSSGPLLYRYSDRVADEQAGPDLPDLEASFSAVTALADLGRWDEAHDRMEGVLRVVAGAGPGGPATTADPLSGEMFGDLPCTAAGLALVEAALALTAGPP
jgi:hypothetical protein